MFNLDAINVLILIIATINIVYGLVVFNRDREDKSSFYFFLLTMSVSFWGLGMFTYRGFVQYNYILISARFLYLAAATIPISFLFFVFSFTKSDWKINFWQKYLLPLPFLCIASFSLFPGALIKAVTVIPKAEDIIVFNNSVHVFYGIYIVTYFLIGYFLLFKRMKTAHGAFKRQIVYIFVGTFLATSIGVTTNLILLLLGDFRFNWMGQIGVVFMITSIFYAILKLHLFNVRIIATELFIFILWIFIFVRSILSGNFYDSLTNIGLLALTILIGFFLIRSERKELAHRERIEVLVKDLGNANTELAQTNERLKDLDKLKSEFLSLASHQIRGPLTVIKGYASEVLEGDFGLLPKNLKEPMKIIFNSSESLIKIVEEFLNISRIEQGRMKYDLEEFNLGLVVDEVYEEWRGQVEEKGLYFERSIDKNIFVRADRGKVKQILSNLIDNAIKYTKDGFIKIFLMKTAKQTALISVKDSGIGISEKTKSKLFQKFSRAEEAFRISPTGSGLGLYVAFHMLRAQNGNIWVESKGEGLGSTFFVELNMIK